MSASGPTGPAVAIQSLPFYPAYCFSASPTYFAWVKLTAWDIHNTLRTRNGFEAQKLYFYLNHPVQFVYVVGVVVAYEDFHERRWILVVDDSSGATIEVTCPKPGKVAVRGGNGVGEGSGKDDWRNAKTKKNGEEETGERDLGSIEDGEKAAAAAAAEEKRTQVLTSIDVGSVIKARGRLSRFRDIRSIQLESVAVVPDTNAEVRFWQQRAEMKADVLSKPWSLTAAEQSRLLKVTEGHVTEKKIYAQKCRAWEAAIEAKEKRHSEMIAKKWEKEEVGREKAAEIARNAGGMIVAKKRSRGESILTPEVVSSAD